MPMRLYIKYKIIYQIIHSNAIKSIHFNNYFLKLLIYLLKIFSIIISITTNVL